MSFRLMTATLTASRKTAAEDIQLGDYLALLRVIWQLPSFLWREDSTLAADEPVLIPMFPEDNGRPLLVKHVCLPFLLVETPDGSCETLDLRRCEVTRLDPEFGRIVSADLKAHAKKLRSLFSVGGLRKRKGKRKKKKRKRREQ